MEFEKSCGAVLFSTSNNKIKYLILHYEEGHWDFPKGKQELDEEEKETVLREIQEETGIADAEFIANFQELTKYYYTRDKKTIHKNVSYYLAKTKTEEVTISHEHIGYTWLSFDKALKKLTFDNAKELLKKANKFLIENNLI
tara:strand:+ start:11668 stop:12093 length:426 start_codon:yes stop_codon:yes gene_type:complete